MGYLCNKMIDRIMAVIMVAIFVVSFRDLIAADQDVSAAFGEIMGTLPFAKLITDIITTLLKYQKNIPIYSDYGVIGDLLKLAVMACLRPLCGWLLTGLFLPLPKGSLEDRERYMERPSYRIKALLITILSAPLLAIASSHLISAAGDIIISKLGTVGAVLAGFLALIAVTGLSLIPLHAFGVAIGTAIAWRLGITIGGKMITTVITNSLCLLIYCTIVEGLPRSTVTAVVVLVVWLIVEDFGMHCLKRAITA